MTDRPQQPTEADGLEKMIRAIEVPHQTAKVYTVNDVCGPELIGALVAAITSQYVSRAAVVEAIGEDESIEKTLPAATLNRHKKRNALRREIRNKLKLNEGA